MYLFLTIIYCLLNIFINGSELALNDDTEYNPCQRNSKKFFYAHRTDPHKYYQCDDFGRKFLRSCGNLVWDDLVLTCNWPSVANHLLTTRVFIPKISTGFTTTSTSLLSPCEPINPCGQHGECIESRKKSLDAPRGYACICSENWYGKFCDKSINKLLATRSTTTSFSIIMNVLLSTSTENNIEKL